MPPPRFYWVCLWIGVLLPASVLAGATDSTGFDADTTSFSVRFGTDVISHRVMAVTVLPNRPTRLTIERGSPTGQYQVEGPDDTVFPISDRKWRFSPPSTPGLYPVTVRDTTSRDAIQLQVFVLTPWDHEGPHLNGYRMGRYEMRARRGLESYEPPAGFIKVTDENRNVRVAPHFRLEQFLCKQTDATPQFALLRTRLLQRLEDILLTLNERGHDVPTLHVMSGYRTPYYNRAIGNSTEYSRHLYGDAADLFVDTDGDQWMDDLTGDGRVTRADARYLARIVRGQPTPGDDRFNGGLGIYGSAAHRGPFVHVDLRGYRARW